MNLPPTRAEEHKARRVTDPDKAAENYRRLANRIATDANEDREG